MQRHPQFFVAIVGTLVLAVLAYAAAGLYTFPGTVSEHSRAVRNLIARALDSTSGRVPPVAAGVGLEPAETLPPPSTLAYPVAGWRQPTTYDPQARDWARRAAARDSGALRGWLGRRVFATQRADGDTMVLTWRRLAVHSGCPWISTLRATLVRRNDRGLHVRGVTATCPLRESP